VADFTDASRLFEQPAARQTGHVAPDGTLQNTRSDFRFDEPRARSRSVASTWATHASTRTSKPTDRWRFVVDDLATVDPWKPEWSSARRAR